MLTLTKRFDDQGEVDEGHEHHVELVEPGEDPAEAFEAAEEPLDLVPPRVHEAIVLPGFDSARIRRHDRHEAEVEHQLPRFGPFIGPIHDHVYWSFYWF